MNTDKDVALELKARTLLLEDIGHIDGRIRSRLNQSRQAAVAAVTTPVRSSWLKWTLLPATGAVCAAALVMVFMLHPAPSSTPKPLDSPNALDVLDLVTDDDTLSQMEDGDPSFYEWAAAQGNAGGAGAGGGA